MTSTSDWNSSASGATVAYFSNAEDARNAINELVDEGFPISEIGAAFHSGAGPVSAGMSASPSRPFHDDISPVGSTASGAGVAGPESNTSGVTPAGLATGSGTGFAGASRPGPIPGSEIPDSLPHEIPSTLHSSNAAPLSGSAMPGEAFTSPEAVPVQSSRRDPSWWENLKHLFSGEGASSNRRIPAAETGSRNFGTGEGDLGIAAFDYPYSVAAFESSFQAMGLPRERARYLAMEIRRGGAIVTVNAGPMNVRAERMLARNNGKVRHEPAIAGETIAEPLHTIDRVHIFGRVQRVYPEYMSSAAATRKAS